MNIDHTLKSDERRREGETDGEETDKRQQIVTENESKEIIISGLGEREGRRGLVGTCGVE